MKKGIIPASILASLAGVLALLAILLPKLQVSEKSQVYSGVADGQEYVSTTTSPWVTMSNLVVLKPGAGVFGGFTITGTNTGVKYTFYDATTSDITLRAPTMATTSIVVGSIPPALTVGSYSYEVGFKNGLLMETTGTVVGTTTVIWK